MVRCIWTMIFPGSKTCTNDRPGWSGEAKTLEGLLSKVLVEVCSDLFFLAGVTRVPGLLDLGQVLCREIVGISPCWRKLCDFNSF